MGGVLMSHTKVSLILTCIVVALMLVSGCDDGDEISQEPSVDNEQVLSLTLTSPVFIDEGQIPQKYTCDNDDKNISPPLEWGDAPENTRSFVLICDDPDAPGDTWVHWLLYNIPADTRTLDENIPASAQLRDSSLHGENSWKAMGYGSPCPPKGTHRYYFKIYALDTILNLESGAEKEDLLESMEGHVLAMGKLMGIYKRQ